MLLGQNAGTAIASGGRMTLARRETVQLESPSLSPLPVRLRVDKANPPSPRSIHGPEDQSAGGALPGWPRLSGSGVATALRKSSIAADA